MLYDQKFIETIEKIQKIRDISYVAIHLIDDEVAQKKSVVVKDVQDQEVEIALYDIFGYSNSQLFVLISLLMNKILDCTVFPFHIQEAVDEARQLFPYTGKQWINEAEARRYSYIVPERYT